MLTLTTETAAFAALLQFDVFLCEEGKDCDSGCTEEPSETPHSSLPNRNVKLFDSLFSGDFCDSIATEFDDAFNDVLQFFLR